MHTISVLYLAHVCMKYSLGISNFLERSLVFHTILNAYLRLIFLPAILISAFHLSSLSFHMMYSTYNLNKHDDKINVYIVV